MTSKPGECESLLPRKRPEDTVKADVEHNTAKQKKSPVLQITLPKTTFSNLPGPALIRDKELEVEAGSRAGLVRLTTTLDAACAALVDDDDDLVAARSQHVEKRGGPHPQLLPAKMMVNAKKKQQPRIRFREDHGRTLLPRACISDGTGERCLCVCRGRGVPRRKEAAAKIW